VSRSHVVLALAAGLVGFVAGRGLPRGAAPVASAAPVTMPTDCKADHAQLVSTKAQLALCLGYRAPSEAETAPRSMAEPASTAGPPNGFAEGFLAWRQARKANERLEDYPEAVIVRRGDGTQAIYRPDEHSVEADDVYARKALDGNVTYYLGADAGPRSDPDAWGSLRDLADLSPDGETVVEGSTRLVLRRHDGGR